MSIGNIAYFDVSKIRITTPTSAATLKFKETAIKVKDYLARCKAADAAVLRANVGGIIVTGPAVIDDANAANSPTVKAVAGNTVQTYLDVSSEKVYVYAQKM